MCIFGAPKPPTAPDPPILRNPYLDGGAAIRRAQSGGVGSLTIQRGATPAPTPATASPLVVAPPATSPTATGIGGVFGKTLQGLVSSAAFQNLRI